MEISRYQIIGLYNFEEEGVRRHVVARRLFLDKAHQRLAELEAAPKPKKVDVSYYIEEEAE